MRGLLDEGGEDTVASSIASATPAASDFNFMFNGSSGIELDHLYPEPKHVFLLWQTFLDRVNPLIKVVHVPALQPRLLEVVTRTTPIPRNIETLLFSIFAITAMSLTDGECVTLLGCAKDEAVERYSSGARIALQRANITKTYDVVILQALVLYMVCKQYLALRALDFKLTWVQCSSAGQSDRHASWIMNGTVVRIAQKMGLHHDGESLGLSVYDSEIRRRVWWQIVVVDSVFAMSSGLGRNILPRHWDTREPSNLNDSDLYPTMTSIQPREGPTEMIFCLVVFQIARLRIDAPALEDVILQNETGTANAPSDAQVNEARRGLDELDQNIDELLAKYSDRSIGLIHEFATDLKHAFVKKMRELVCPMREQLEWGTEILTSKDNLFKISIISVEHFLSLYLKADKQGNFVWFSTSTYATLFWTLH